jgi:hypothetical protein
MGEASVFSVLEGRSKNSEPSRNTPFWKIKVRIDRQFWPTNMWASIANPMIKIKLAISAFHNSLVCSAKNEYLVSY